MNSYRIYFPLFDHVESRSNEVRLTHEGLLAHPRVTLVDTPDAADFLVFCQNHLVEHCPYHTRFRPIKDQYKERTILLDYGDDPYFIHDADDFRWRLYFKRSCVDRNNSRAIEYLQRRVIPTAYCLMDDMVDPPENWNGNRDIDVACLFDASVEETPWYKNGRGELRKFARRFSVNHRVAMKLGTVSECGPVGRSAVDPEYKRTLYNSKIILHANSDPWEGDSRTWESVGSGALVFVDGMFAPIRKPLVDGEHIIFYDFSDDGMKMLEQRIMYFLREDRERTDISQWGRSFVLENHRSINRVNEIVDELDRDTGWKGHVTVDDESAINPGIAASSSTEGGKTSADRQTTSPHRVRHSTTNLERGIATEQATDIAVGYDNRFKRLSRNRQYIIINNYKCGYSSSNMLETEPVQEITVDDRVVLFYRNIFHRAVSVFINWCITDDRYRQMDGWLFDNIRDVLNAGDFESFMDKFHTGRIEDAFVTYICLLEAIYRKNNHTLPQTNLLKYFDVRRIDFLVNLANSENFKTITGISFPFEPKNASDKSMKALCLDLLQTNARLRATVRGIYMDDVVHFRKHGISIDEC